jgi:hypothetical protein
MKHRITGVLSVLLLGGLLTHSFSAVAQPKTAKACREEWRANKAALQASGKSEKTYVAECRAGAAPAPQPSSSSTPTSSPSTAPATPPAIPATAPRRARTPSSTPGSATPSPGQFASEAEAKAKCPSDTIVWVNLASKVYHYSGTRSYGKTKRGAYMCEGDTAGQGMRPSKTERRPS